MRRNQSGLTLTFLSYCPHRRFSLGSDASFILSEVPGRFSFTKTVAGAALHVPHTGGDGHREGSGRPAFPRGLSPLFSSRFQPCVLFFSESQPALLVPRVWEVVRAQFRVSYTVCFRAWFSGVS
jgi:hypothetical protein